MMLGLGSEDWGEGGYGVPTAATPAVTSLPTTNYAGLWDTIFKGGFALVGSQVQKPLYQTSTTPSGSQTTIYGSSAGLNYPGGVGPTSVPTSGVSVTTMLMLGIAAMTLLVMMRK